MADSILLALKEDNYTLLDLTVVLYDRRRSDIFPIDYISSLYKKCIASGRRSKLGILPQTFCGMADLSHDAIFCYLANKPLLIFGRGTPGKDFIEYGFIFPVVFMGKPPERASIIGYATFKHVWGRLDLEIVCMLALAYYFVEYQLKAIHGIRYDDNHLTNKFGQRYGFKESGRVPRYMLDRTGSELVEGVVSSLMIEDFERYVEEKLLELDEGGWKI